jgi:suppressor of fused
MIGRDMIMPVQSKKNPKGIHAIDSALRVKYENDMPLVFAPMISRNGGGDDPLEMISVYDREEPIPHWHFITYGFSDLYEKSMKNTPISGYGFELTFRVLKKTDETEPPEWVITFLQDLARHVFETGSRFDNGFFLGTTKKIKFNKNNNLNTIVFTYDPELKPINTPNGIVVFLEVVGITEEEKISMISWNSTKFLETFREKIPLFITDMNRESVLNDPNMKSKIEKGISIDGSSTETLMISSLVWREEKKRFGSKKLYEIDLSRRYFMEFKNLVQWRLGKGRDLTLMGSQQRVTLSMRDQSSTYVNDFELKVFMNLNVVKELIEKLGAGNSTIEMSGLKNVKFNIVD